MLGILLPLSFVYKATGHSEDGELTKANSTSNDLLVEIYGIRCSCREKFNEWIGSLRKSENEL